MRAQWSTDAHSTTQFQMEQNLLTGLDKLWCADLAVAPGADSIHCELVELTTLSICEVTHIVHRLTLCCCASIVFSLSHIVEGVVGVLPPESDDVGGAIVLGLS